MNKYEGGRANYKQQEKARVQSVKKSLPLPELWKDNHSSINYDLICMATVTKKWYYRWITWRRWSQLQATRESKSSISQEESTTSWIMEGQIKILNHPHWGFHKLEKLIHVDMLAINIPNGKSSA